MTKVGSYKLRFKSSLKGILSVFRKHPYVLVAFFGTILASSFIMWSLNLDLVFYVLFQAPISLLAKLDFFFSVYRDLFLFYPSLQAVGLVVFSVFFGINGALLVYVFKHHGFKKLPKKSSSGGLLLALVSGGCVACGTSLFAPILASFGAVSTTLLRDISLVANWIGSIFVLFSIYSLGLIALQIQASKTNQ